MTIPNESFSGKGRLHIDGREVGNALATIIAHTNENIDQLDFTAPGGGLYNRISRVTEQQLNISLADYSLENLKLAMLGTSDTNTSTSVTDESVSAATPVDRLIQTAEMIDVTQTVSVTSDPAGTTHVEGTDYEVSAAGITPIAGGGISPADPLLVSYTSLDSYTVYSLTAAQLEHKVTLVGSDEAQDGDPFVMTAWKVKFPAADELQWLSEEFGTLDLAGVVIKDTSQTAGSQYFEVKKKQPS